MSTLFDHDTEFGARAERRLRRERIGWLVTTGADGTPQPTPLWFVWDGETILMYSEPSSAKVRRIARNPRSAFHLDSKRSGDDIVILTGEAAVDPDAPPVHENAPYVGKYREEMQRLGLGSPKKMGKTYSVAIRFRPTKVRGF